MNTLTELTNRITNYTYDTVEKRGTSIFCEWKENRVASRRVVGYAERSVRSMKENRTAQSCFEALSCLYALDMRVREKYKSIIRCLLSYFSWKRETRALSLLITALSVTKSGDVRQLIESVLDEMREGLKEEATDERVDGGKANRPSNEIESDSVKGKNADASETDKEETSELSEEQKKNADEKEKNSDSKEGLEAESDKPKDGEKTVDASKELEVKENALKTESDEKLSGAETETKQSEDAKLKVNENKREIDYAPLPEDIYYDTKLFEANDLARERLTDNESNNKTELFENWPKVYESNAEPTIAYREGINENTRIGEVGQRIEAVENNEGIEKQETTEKLTDNGHFEKEHSKKETSDNRTPEEKIADISKEENREAIQTELSEDAENEMRRQINDNLTVEQIVAFKQGLEQKMREKICIEEAIFNAEENAKQGVKEGFAQVKQEAKQSNMVDRR